MRLLPLMWLCITGVRRRRALPGEGRPGGGAPPTRLLYLVSVSLMPRTGAGRSAPSATYPLGFRSPDQQVQPLPFGAPHVRW